MTNNEQYKTTSMSLGEFFSSDLPTCLQIPHYQRGYSWEEDQILHFITDLIDHNESTTNGNYFFGTITTINKEINGIATYEIIDGQQRMTTALILLICIRDIFDEKNSPLTKEIEREISNHKLEKYKHKLILDNKDNPFFQKYIVDDISKEKINRLENLENEHVMLESHTNLRNAYLKIRKELWNEWKQINEKTLNKDAYFEWLEFLNSLRHTLRDKFIVSNLKVNTPSTAYTLFNRMNHRGRKLTSADLAKNLILSKIDEKSNGDEITINKALGVWECIEDQMKRSKKEMDSFLHTYLVTFHSSIEHLAEKNSSRSCKCFTFRQDSQTFDDLETILKNKMDGMELLDDINRKFRDYAVLSTGTRPHKKISDKAADSLTWIKKLKIRIVYPVLMVALNTYEKTDIEKISDLVLRWHFRSKTIAGRNASGLEIELARLAHEIQHHELSFKEVKTRLSKNQHLTDHSFESIFRDIKFESTTVAKYVLTKIIEKTQDRDLVLSKKITLEHIMPKNGIEKITNIQKLDKFGEKTPEKFRWIDYIKNTNNLNDDRDVKLFHQKYRNRLGNLTLVDKKKNSALGVQPFERKCRGGENKQGEDIGCFQNSSININRDISCSRPWNQDAIEKRQHKLAKYAAEVWKI